MFLSLGGSRRRANSGIGVTQGDAQGQGSLVLQDFCLQRGAQEDPLQTLATGKYAPSRASSVTILQPFHRSLIRSTSFCEDLLPSFEAISAGCGSPGPGPGQVQVQVRPVSSFTTPRSPMPTLPSYLPSLPALSRESSRVSGGGGISLHGVPGGEEVISRDCSRFEQPCSRRSHTLDLAKKLKNSLGNKFADSLRETINEVVMKRDRVDGEGKHDGGDAWTGLPQSFKDIASLSGSEGGVSGKSWNGCRTVEKNSGNVVTAADHSNLLSFSAASARSETESSLKMSFGGSIDHSKPSRWLSQENFPQMAMAADLTCNLWDASSSTKTQVISTPSSSLDTQFLTNESEMSLCAVLQESSVKGQWINGSTSSRPPRTRSAYTRRHTFPEAAAMGTCTPDSLLQQTNLNLRPRVETSFSGSKPNPESLYNIIKNYNGEDQSRLGVLKGFQTSSKEYGSFLHPPSNRELHGKSATEPCDEYLGQVSNTKWHKTAAPTSYNNAPLLNLPECEALGFNQPCNGERTVKRTRDVTSSSVHSKRPCTTDPASIVSVQLALPPVIAKSDFMAGGFEEYFAGARPSTFELPSSPLPDLVEILGQDSLLPHSSS